MKPILALCTLFLVAMSAEGNPDSRFPKSPEVNEDGSVTFRFLAPQAKEVRVSGSVSPESLRLEKTATGLWQGTTGPLDPGIYDYRFEVDGTYALDPHNRWLKPWRRSSNQVLVPGDPPKLWERQEVPQGTVHQHTYFSEKLAVHREFFVYTPAAYREGDEPLPVLYLLHGSGDDASGWITVGRAPLIADNLIAQGKAKPMLIVMPLGHGNLPGIDMDAIDDGDRWFRENDKAVRESFFGEVIPMVESRYRVETKPGGRAIAGLSMGGGQALEFGLSRPDVFDWVAGFSSAAPKDEAEAAREIGDLADASFRMIWLGCGEKDFLLDRNKFFHGWLEERGIEHTWRLTKGGHTWDVWRDYLIEVLPLLFEEKAEAAPAPDPL